MRVEVHSALIEKIVRGTKYSRVVEPFTFTVDDMAFTIPTGFEYDGSSVPWGARNIVDRRKVRIAGLVHDYLYRYQPLTRAKADQVWRIVAQMGDVGTRANVIQGWLGWVGLRMGGWIAWRAYSGT